MTTRKVLTALGGLAALSAALILGTREYGDLWFPLFVLGVAGTVATLVVLMKRGETPFTKWHHAYIGLALAAQPWSMLVQLVGLYALADDLYQHWRQLRFPVYASPLHRLYVRVFRWVRKRLDAIGLLVAILYMGSATLAVYALTAEAQPPQLQVEVYPAPETPKCVRVLIAPPGSAWLVRNDTLIVALKPPAYPGWFCQPGATADDTLPVRPTSAGSRS